MGYYDSAEPLWEGVMSFTCSAEVERKMVTPEMERLMSLLEAGPDNPWREELSLASRVASDSRHLFGTITRLILHYKSIEPMVRVCGWEGETECCLVGSKLLWTCPVCGEEHEDPGDRLEEPDGMYDNWKEAEGIA